jgi:hypothetical protein
MRWRQPQFWSHFKRARPCPVGRAATARERRLATRQRRPADRQRRLRFAAGASGRPWMRLAARLHCVRTRRGARLSPSCCRPPWSCEPLSRPPRSCSSTAASASAPTETRGGASDCGPARQQAVRSRPLAARIRKCDLCGPRRDPPRQTCSPYPPANLRSRMPVRFAAQLSWRISSRAGKNSAAQLGIVNEVHCGRDSAVRE